MTDTTTGVGQPAPNYDSLNSFAECVDVGLSIRTSEDSTQWMYGALVNRVKAVEPEATLGDFASELQKSPSRLSECATVEAFYPPGARTFDELYFEHYLLAYKASDGELDNALELLDYAQTHYLKARQFKRWLDGIWCETLVPVDFFTPEQRAALLIPTNATHVWVETSKPKETE